MTSTDRKINPQATAAIEKQIKSFQEELESTTSIALKTVIEKIIVGLKTVDIKNMSFTTGFGDIICIYYLLTKKDSKYLKGDKIYFIPPEEVSIIDSKVEFECISGKPSISIEFVKDTIISIFNEYKDKLDEEKLTKLCEIWENKTAYIHDGDFAKLVRIKKDKYILWIHPELLVPEAE